LLHRNLTEELLEQEMIRHKVKHAVLQELFALDKMFTKLHQIQPVHILGTQFGNYASTLTCNPNRILGRVWLPKVYSQGSIIAVVDI
jgi:hypothetical protein